MKINLFVLVCLLVFSCSVLAQTVETAPAIPPQTTSVSSLLAKIDELKASIEDSKRDIAEMRLQFDKKLERIRQSDQIFYLSFNAGFVFLFVLLNALYNRLMFKRRQRQFLEFQAAFLEKQRVSLEEMKRLNLEIVSIEAALSRINEEMKRVSPEFKPEEKKKKRFWEFWRSD